MSMVLVHERASLCREAAVASLKASMFVLPAAERSLDRER